MATSPDSGHQIVISPSVYLSPYLEREPLRKGAAFPATALTDIAVPNRARKVGEAIQSST